MYNVVTNLRLMIFGDGSFFDRISCRLEERIFLSEVLNSLCRGFGLNFCVFCWCIEQSFRVFYDVCSSDSLLSETVAVYYIENQGEKWGKILRVLNNCGMLTLGFRVQVKLCLFRCKF